MDQPYNTKMDAIDLMLKSFMSIDIESSGVIGSDNSSRINGEILYERLNEFFDIVDQKMVSIGSQLVESVDYQINDSFIENSDR